ncbi:unnamed protein product [Rhodiola kirilowii]
MKFASMDEFWVFYLTQHSKPWTRRWHFVSTAASMVLLISAFAFSWWYAVLMPVVAYGLAWYSHFFVEGNVPLTFGYPVWALLCDWKMFGLMLTGKMDKELNRLAKKKTASTGTGY